VEKMVSTWSNAVTTAVTDSLTRIINYLPNIIFAIIILLLGVILGWALKTVVVRVAGFLNLKQVNETLGLDKIFKGKVDLKGLLGEISQWTIIIIFLAQALEILDLTQVTEVVNNLVGYIDNVIAAVFIILIGSIVADLVARVVTDTSNTVGVKTSDVLADVARYSIITFVVFAALTQLGIATDLLERLFTGFVALVAIAGGIAFGLGGQDAAKDMINRARKNLPK